MGMSSLPVCLKSHQTCIQLEALGIQNHMLFHQQAPMVNVQCNNSLHAAAKNSSCQIDQSRSQWLLIHLLASLAKTRGLSWTHWHISHRSIEI